MPVFGTLPLGLLQQGLQGNIVRILDMPRWDMAQNRLETTDLDANVYETSETVQISIYMKQMYETSENV